MPGILSNPILVTGSTCFIGSNLARHLVIAHKYIHLIIRKESDLWGLNDVLKKANVHLVDLVDKIILEKVIILASGLGSRLGLETEKIKNQW